MQTITTQKYFVFRNDKTGDICSVPRSATIQAAKKVPDWVLETKLFKLGVKDGSISVVEVKTPNILEEAKVENPIEPQISVDDALNAKSDVALVEASSEKG